jgi:hypothetical protein
MLTTWQTLSAESDANFADKRWLFGVKSSPPNSGHGGFLNLANGGSFLMRNVCDLLLHVQRHSPEDGVSFMKVVDPETAC